MGPFSGPDFERFTGEEWSFEVPKVGVFEVPIRLHEDVRPIVSVNVLQEDEEESAEVEDSEEVEKSPDADVQQSAEAEENSVDSTKVETETE